MADEIQYIKMANLEVPIIPSIATTEARGGEGGELDPSSLDEAASPNTPATSKPNGNCWGC